MKLIMESWRDFIISEQIENIIKKLPIPDAYVNLGVTDLTRHLRNLNKITHSDIGARTLSYEDHDSVKKHLKAIKQRLDRLAPPGARSNEYLRAQNLYDTAKRGFQDIKKLPQVTYDKPAQPPQAPEPVRTPRGEIIKADTPEAQSAKRAFSQGGTPDAEDVFGSSGRGATSKVIPKGHDLNQAAQPAFGSGNKGSKKVKIRKSKSPRSRLIRRGLKLSEKRKAIKIAEELKVAMEGKKLNRDQIEDIVKLARKKAQEEILSSSKKSKKLLRKIGGRAFKKVPILGTALGVFMITDKAHAAMQTTDPEEKDRLYLEIAEEIWAMTPFSLATDIAQLFVNGLINNINNYDPSTAVLQPSYRSSRTDALMGI